MIDFILTGYPRSATTWLANLFTTDNTFCLHDPIEEYTLEQLEAISMPGKVVGAACSGLWMHPTWMNSVPCRKVVIVRPVEECNQSLAEIGIAPLTDDFTPRLFQIDAPRVDFAELWDEKVMQGVWDYLLPIPFDVVRYRLLRKFAIQPQFQALTVKPEVMRDYIRRVSGG